MVVTLPLYEWNSNRLRKLIRKRARRLVKPERFSIPISSEDRVGVDYY